MRCAMTSERTSAACATFAATRVASAPAASTSASVSRPPLSVRSIVGCIVAVAHPRREGFMRTPPRVAPITQHLPRPAAHDVA